MGTVSQDQILEILKKTSEGNGTFLELAEALNSLEDMNMIVPPNEFMRFTQDLSTAVEEKGYGKVTTKDAESPKVVGLTTKKGGFVPRVFTDGESAREYAVTSGLIQPDENLFTQTCDWVNGLHQFLAQGYEGIIIDSGTDHQVNLERKPLARLLALMSIEDFAALDTIHLMLHKGRPHIQESEKGRAAFVYDNPGAARWAVDNVRQQGATAQVQDLTPLSMLETVLPWGVDTLIINASLADERFYVKTELLEMVQILGGDAEAILANEPVADPALQPAPTSADRATTGQAELPKPLSFALATPTLPMVDPPQITDEENRRRFAAWSQPIQEKSVVPWQFIEALAHEMYLYVPIHFRNVDGLHWPQFFRHPGEENKTVMYFYTEETRVKASLSKSAPESQNYTKLPALEALRWAWAAPTKIDEFGIDWPDKDASILFPALWSLMPLFPLFMDLGDASQIADVGLARLGALPGARALKPQISKCLATQWRRLVEADGREDGECYLWEHGGEKWLPVFSDVEQFAVVATETPGWFGERRMRTEEPPFQRWIEQTNGCAGVILNPQWENPITLDTTDLVILSAWAKNGGQPYASDVIRETARLLHNETITETQAAIVAAQVPCYRACTQPMEGGGIQVLQVPDTDMGILFSNASNANVYLNMFRQMGLIGDQMQQVNLFNRWDQSPLRMMADAFTAGVWIDPDPLGGCGLRLSHEALSAAVEWLNTPLKPRVPGFTVKL